MSCGRRPYRRADRPGLGRVSAADMSTNPRPPPAEAFCTEGARSNEGGVLNPQLLDECIFHFIAFTQVYNEDHMYRAENDGQAKVVHKTPQGIKPVPAIQKPFMISTG